MKIALLSGADKNAGDFLIVRRSRALLEGLLPGSEVVEFPRNESLEPLLDEVNACDRVVFAGGPGYVPDMYPGRFPLVDDLPRIEPPMFALGMGSYAQSPDIGGIRFSDSSRLLLDRLASDGFGLGCRDRLTERLLRQNGYVGAFFTGCPAWYDFSFVDQGLVHAPRWGEVRSIAVSDPALAFNFDAPMYLIRELRAVFPGCRFVLVFHRGWSADAHSDRSLACRQRSLLRWAEANGVECVDIAYGSGGFSVYDECDLHVGYRVHAHLYCTSRRRPTFLIEEDGRGWGANDALGRSEHIGICRPALVPRKASAALGRLGVAAKVPNASLGESARLMAEHVVREVESGYPENARSCALAREAFARMREHVGRLASPRP